MAEAVVDHLEVVEVDEQDRDLPDVRNGEQVGEHRHHRIAVGEIGQLVVRRGVGQPFGGAPLVGDVLDVGDRQRHTVVLGDRHPRARPDELAIAAQVALVEQVRVGDAEFEAGALGGHGPQVVGMRDLADTDAHERLERPSEHVGERLVGVDDLAVVETHERHPGGRRMERLLEAAARLLERDRTLLAVGDIVQDHDQRALGDGGTVQRRLGQVGTAGHVDHLEHRQVPARAGAVVGATIAAVGVAAEFPALGDRAAVVVGDEAEERPPDQIVDRSSGQHRRPGVGRLDHAVFVETHHRIGKGIEELARARRACATTPRSSRASAS